MAPVIHTFLRNFSINNDWLHFFKAMPWCRHWGTVVWTMCAKISLTSPGHSSRSVEKFDKHDVHQILILETTCTNCWACILVMLFTSTVVLDPLNCELPVEILIQCYSWILLITTLGGCWLCNRKLLSTKRAGVFSLLMEIVVTIWLSPAPFLPSLFSLRFQTPFFDFPIKVLSISPLPAIPLQARKCQIAPLTFYRSFCSS